MPEPAELEKKLNQYAREVDPEASFRIHIDPDYPKYVPAEFKNKVWGFEAHPIPGRFVAMIANTEEAVRNFPQDEAVALFAHEAGHLEQHKDIREMKPIPPPIQLDAWRRGIKWAEKWGVLETYGRMFVKKTVAQPPPLQFEEDVQRIIAQINELRLLF